MSFDSELYREVSDEPTYPIREVADMTGISAYTLRYYDKCGFFPNLYRGKNNVRSFSDIDVMRLKLIDALRKSGLSIDGIKYFVRLSAKGQETMKEQYQILRDRQTVLEYQIAEIEESLNVLQGETRRRASQLLII